MRPRIDAETDADKDREKSRKMKGNRTRIQHQKIRYFFNMFCKGGVPKSSLLLGKIGGFRRYRAPKMNTLSKTTRPKSMQKKCPKKGYGNCGKSLKNGKFVTKMSKNPLNLPNFEQIGKKNLEI